MLKSIHEEPDKICESPPWYANYEWKHRGECRTKGVTAILGVGFDPGVVNAYCSYAQKHFFDRIDTIDIMDVNAGDHGSYCATNFDAEINFRELTSRARKSIRAIGHSPSASTPTVRGRLSVSESISTLCTSTGVKWRPKMGYYGKIVPLND